METDQEIFIPDIQQNGKIDLEKVSQDFKSNVSKIKELKSSINRREQIMIYSLLWGFIFFNCLMAIFPITSIILSQMTLTCNNTFEPLNLNISNYLLGDGIISLISAIMYIIKFFTPKHIRTDTWYSITLIDYIMVIPMEFLWFAFGTCIIFQSNTECMHEPIVKYSIAMWAFVLCKLNRYLCSLCPTRKYYDEDITDNNTP